MKSFSQMLANEKTVPVVAVENAEQAVGLSQALIEGGVGVIEVTLRNAFGLEALKLIKREVPDMILLAGTVNSAAQLQQVADAGVDGVISPGLTPLLAKTANDLKMPYLPGAASASDILLAIEYGLSELKLFPASIVGGIPALKAFSGPFPNIKFCPTGGVSDSNYKEYLALDNVMCVGGTWFATSDQIKRYAWDEIINNCRALSQA
ncbi:MAG: bifunctional 4-hydroxy-2-oxoglutarate aldolase/2-dehydro-3-deoxy-phosphogluconate aldolase [Arenicella sp.]|jgi:2-dehydro-3-deoxyphosphogluconate aldolase/(4S)-4-hydroxy-2-oxoglutarate aldolase|nr:bifunctional 4-hydroxy-2-oxoglutarate aldolase/2-dehydro-3-deoxy-phosphogluconate aldolase [bacterium]MDG1905321.1 bifunctional 4-hydroxy-2-oxoglutarate aldolase/2-dehydro-3-deoxy-phosphogluconate aldolase [Arenicella sp.]HAU69380.1 keto-deoxy-phosphogluconate aldolase [Gammaproteobacteria bacterium]